MKRILSLFSGCGGLDVGFEGDFKAPKGRHYCNLGFRVFTGVDHDKWCVRTHWHNNPSKVALQADVRKMTFRDGAYELVTAGFPCQPYSSANPRRTGGGDVPLYIELVKALAEVRPRAFLAENVPGFMTMDKGRWFRELLESLSGLGYQCHHAILNAADYGVPQRRRRLFIAGVYPKGESPFPLPDGGAQPHVGPFLDPHDEVPRKYFFSPAAVRGAFESKERTGRRRACALDPDKPSLTITANLSKYSICSYNPVVLVSKEPGPTATYRKLTPREAARIQTFPDSFKFPVSNTQAWKMIGNAVPPVLAWRIAEAMRNVWF